MAVLGVVGLERTTNLAPSTLLLPPSSLPLLLAAAVVNSDDVTLVVVKLLTADKAELPILLFGSSDVVDSGGRSASRDVIGNPAALVPSVTLLAVMGALIVEWL